MRKKLLLLFLTIVAVACLAFGVTACGGGSSSTKDTYYLYKNGSYDYTNYITLSGSSWEDDDGETGTYKISGSTITFYYELLGETEELMDGTISDGVMTLNIMGATYTYCLEGKTPSSSGTDDGDTSTTYTVTYNANGGAFADGSETYTQTVNSGTTLTAPASPTKDGCTFAGWATSKNGSTMWQFGSDKVTSNTTLYASWSEQSASILSVDGASIDGTEISMLVDHNTDSVSLSTKVVCSSDSTWKLYYDKLGQTEIPTKIAASTTGSLYNGDNVFYIVVTSTDGTQVNVYTLTIYRSYAVYVTYYDGTTAIKTETAYTGYSFTTTYTPDISGYTFNYWKASSGSKFTETTLTSALSLYADKTANDYTITYDVNGGNELASTTKTVTYDSSYTLAVPTRTGYSFSGWYYGSTQLTDEEGKSLAVWSYADDTTIAAKWTANDYTVTLNLSNSSAGMVTGDGDHAYDSSVTIKAIPNIGYTCTGWYNYNGELVSTSTSYTFTMGTNTTYTAKIEVDTAMSNFEFTSTSTACNITGIKDNTVTEIIVPDYVTSISGGAFSGCSDLINITLPFVGSNAYATTASISTLFGYIFGVKSYIGGNATRQENSEGVCTYYLPTTLTTVTITGGDILYGAFSYCVQLTSITIPDSVTSIARCAFEYCTSLTSITIPDSVTSIDNYAFEYCTSLESITIPDGVTSIGGSAFYDCTSLESITIPDSVTSIGDYAFRSTAYYNDASNWENDVLYISNYLIKAKNTISGSYTINEKTIGIADWAFSNCSSLTSITIPDSVISIGLEAFIYCTSLENINIPDSVTNIGAAAFYDTAYYNDTDSWDNDILYINNCLVYTNKNLSGHYSIKEGTLTIGYYAFGNCASLTSVTV